MTRPERRAECGRLLRVQSGSYRLPKADFLLALREMKIVALILDEAEALSPHRKTKLAWNN